MPERLECEVLQKARYINTLTFYLYLKWGTFLPNLGMLGLWVLELFAMYATDGQTDRWKDGQKQRLLPPSYARRHNTFN